MTDRRVRVWIAAGAFLLACAPSLAGAHESGTAATTASKPTSDIRAAANVDVPAPRVAKVPVTRTSFVHRRRVARHWRRTAPVGAMRLAYRPAAETMCSNSLCGPPVVLFLGIGY
jgi:hypothetical protein